MPKQKIPSRDADEPGLWSAESFLLRDRQLTIDLALLTRRVVNLRRGSLTYTAPPILTEPHLNLRRGSCDESRLAESTAEQVWTVDETVDAAGLLYGLRVAAEESREAAAEARAAAAAAQAATTQLTASGAPATTLAHLAGRFEGNPLWSEMEAAAAEPWSDVDAD